MARNRINEGEREIPEGAKFDPYTGEVLNRRPALNTCRYCGEIVAKDQEFCPHCGETLYRKCTKCHTKIYRDEQYCPNCGAPVKVTCKKCGEKIYSDEKFCPFCGEKQDNKIPLTPWGTPLIPGAPIVLPPIGPDGRPVEVPEETPKAIAARKRPEPEIKDPVVYETLVGVRYGIVGLVLSLLSILLPPLSIAGIIVSIVGLRRDSRRGAAIAGLVIGIIVLLAYVACCIWLFAFGGWNVLTGWLGFSEAAIL